MTKVRSGTLTLNFSWREVVASVTAARKRIDNTLPEELAPNAEQTARYMEAVRLELGGRPLKVNSWYRCPALNAAVGGSKTSVHPKALAVDFEPVHMPLPEAFEKLAQSGLPFDQLIHERTKDGADWIHIGFAELNKTHRREILRATGTALGGPMAFTRVAKG